MTNFQLFVKKFLSRLYIHSLVYGNISADAAVDMYDYFHQRLVKEEMGKSSTTIHEAKQNSIGRGVHKMLLLRLREGARNRGEKTFL